MKKDCKEYELFLDEVKKAWDSDYMQDFLIKKIQEVVTLSDGKIITIDKPKIETSFCFGYGWCGRSDEEDEERADNMAVKANSDINYFIDKNLKELKRQLEILKSEKPIVVGYSYGVKCKLCYWSIRDRSTDLIDKEIFVLENQEDRNRLIAGYENVIASFTKRLNTYLKKYGLTKVRSWSFLRD